ncbi:MAG: hypothetical protein HYS13_10780 [Planctomycetia bacterium]|nr:hypothetical protein [Planctomycetia bacterium]
MPKRRPKRASDERRDNKRGGSKPRSATVADERRTAEILTIAWMLAVFTALALEIGCISVSALSQQHEPLKLLARYLFFAAVVIGPLSLVLGYFANRLRKLKAPRGLVFFCTVVGAAPLVLVLLMFLAR